MGAFSLVLFLEMCCTIHTLPPSILFGLLSCFFVWLLFKCLCVVGFRQFDSLSWYTFLHAAGAWGCLRLLDLWVYNSQQSEKDWRLLFILLFLCPHLFRDSHYKHISFHIVAHYSIFCSFSSLLFSLCVSFCIISMAMPLN